MDDQIKCIIFDLDNTLYDFVTCYSSALMGAMDDVIGKDTEKHMEVLDRLEKFFAWSGTVEYWPESAGKLHVETWSRLRTTFSKGLIRNIELYAGIIESLGELRRMGLKVCAATNAPIGAALSRLSRLGCLDYFDEIAGWSGGRIDCLAHRLWSDTPVSEDISASWSGKIVRVDSVHRKPSDLMYRKIIDGVGLPTSNVFVVGDSISRDLSPAYHLGLRVGWARYGTYILQEHGRALDRLTPWLGGRQAEMQFSFPYVEIEQPHCLTEFVRDSRH